MHYLVLANNSMQAMEKIPKHYYKKQWYKDIEFNIEPIQDVFNKVGEKIFNPHRLDFHQFLFVKNGGGEHEVDFNTFKLQDHTIVPLIIGQIQSYKKNTTIDGYIIAFTSDFLVNDKNDRRYLYDFTLFNTLLKPLVVPCNDEIIKLIELLNSAFIHRNNFDYREVLRTYLKLILLKLEHTKRKMAYTSVDASIAISLRFNEALERHINYKTKINEVCKEMNVNYKKVSTAIKSTTRKTPKQLLDERIVLELKRQLAYTDASVKEIANTIGFEEAANLTNYFKKHTGQSPSAFRTLSQSS